eukprot:120015-Prymnesium_polylepis.1
MRTGAERRRDGAADVVDRARQHRHGAGRRARAAGAGQHVLVGVHQVRDGAPRDVWPAGRLPRLCAVGSSTPARAPRQR